jgi:F420-non-reducing hydrogenase large subunit
MDKTFTIEPIRWQEDPAKITVYRNGAQTDTFFQIVTTKNIENICRGRLVEELPRITPIIASAHHLAAARALDDLFAVEPPPMALNMRAGLLLAQTFTSHLRKLYFLLSYQVNPFEDFRTVERRHRSKTAVYTMLNDIMHHLSLAQEAEIILGGRNDHPLSAVAGGVGHFLKEERFERLAEIAESCVRFISRLGAFFHTEIFNKGKAMDRFKEIEFHPMATITLADAEDAIVLKDVTGKETDRFPVARAFEKIGLHREAWTLSPFAYVREKGWQGLQAEQTGSLCFAGPLARLNGGEPLTSPMAEEERQCLIEVLGPFPHFGPVAAYWALLVELAQTAEKMKGLYTKEQLTGAEIRTIPSGMNRSGCAAVESPEGLIFHEYEVNDRGVVENIRVMDVATANNALRCVIVQKIVSEAMTEGLDLPAIKDLVEISLLPF